MTVNKNRQHLKKAAAKRPRRAQTQRPSLQMASSARQTDWTCPTCRAIGSVDHPDGSTHDEILTLVRAHHSVQQPSCQTA
jgi:hypothetical protein